MNTVTSVVGVTKEETQITTAMGRKYGEENTICMP